MIEGIKISELPRATALAHDAMFEVAQDGGSAAAAVSQIANLTSKVTAQTTWTKSLVTLTGASQPALAANPDRVGFIIFNRIGNNPVEVDIAGGIVAPNSGRTITSGNDYYFTGAYGPAGAVTVLGTAGQIINVWEGV